MSFGDKILRAYHELTAPEKQELIGESDNTDKKIDNNSVLQKAVDNLKEKIKISRTGVERNLLENQLEELNQLWSLYLESKSSSKITEKTKQNLRELFIGIAPQISLESDKISDDLQKIETTLESEKDKLKDNIWNSDESYRDFIENTVNISGFGIDGLSKIENTFYDIFTLEYINYLNKYQDKNKTRINLKQLNTHKLLFFQNSKDLDAIIYSVIDKLNENGLLGKIKNKDILFPIIQENGEKINKKINISEHIQNKQKELEIKKTEKLLKQRIQKEKEIKAINESLALKEIIELGKEVNSNYKLLLWTLDNISHLESSNKKDTKETKTEIKKLKRTIKLHRTKIDELSKDVLAKQSISGKTKGELLQIFEKELAEDFLYGAFIEVFGIPKSSEDILINVMKKNLVGFFGTVRINQKGGGTKDEKFKLTQNFIEEKKDLIINNTSSIIKLFLAIESHGGQNIPNKNNSGAYGYFQFKDNNGEQGYELLGADKKYYSIDFKKRKEVKTNNPKFEKDGKLRQVRNRNSFEMAIKRADLYFGDNKPKWFKDLLSNFDINNNYKTKVNSSGEKNVSPLDLTSEEQTNLWIIDFMSRAKKKELQNISNMLVGSMWDAKKAYAEIHHTKPDEETKKIINTYGLLLNVLKIPIKG